MTDDWVYITDVDDDECGRFSISSWLVDALPQKPKKSPKFTQIWNNFNLEQSFLLSTTRNHSDSHLEPPCVKIRKLCDY